MVLTVCNILPNPALLVLTSSLAEIHQCVCVCVRVCVCVCVGTCVMCSVAVAIRVFSLNRNATPPDKYIGGV